MPPEGRYPPRRPVTVVDVAQPTPRTVRVTVRGDLADWPEPGPAAHIKVFLPDTPSGPVMRTYTVRRCDRERGLVAIDFLLNEGLGPATQWAARAVPGMRLELGGRSRSTFTLAEDAGSYLFIGDETALPAIATCLEMLPASAAATAVIEVKEAGEAQPFASDATVGGQWVLRGGSGPGLTEMALAEASAAPYTRVWVACEAGQMRDIRRKLLLAGVSADRLSTRGYWKRGEADHSDHDTGEDIAQDRESV
jgi:NADPH-dependent ferric siderophore reductase